MSHRPEESGSPVHQLEWKYVLRVPISREFLSNLTVLCRKVCNVIRKIFIVYGMQPMARSQSSSTRAPVPQLNNKGRSGPQRLMRLFDKLNPDEGMGESFSDVPAANLMQGCRS